MQEYFTNQKLEFAEELVLYTDSHIFLTGRAGTGKTTFLRNLRAKTYKRMVVVAPTGVAAINAGGQTIHSFFQLPFGPQIPEDGIQLTKVGQPSEGEGLVAGNESPKANARALASQYQKLRKSKLNIIRSLDLLVIDEISMVRADVLDAIDAVLRRARRSQKPFGGVQLLMIGYQRAKSVALLESDKKSKGKVSIKDDLKGNSLYKRLHAWRAERADELDVEVYRIVPTTALKAIAKEQPVTLRELKAIKGMGDKRVKQFGAEILDIILRSLGQSPDESPSPADPDTR